MRELLGLVLGLFTTPGMRVKETSLEVEREGRALGRELLERGQPGC